MLILHVFRVKTSNGSETINGPNFGERDMTELKKLFPNAGFWKCDKSALNNIYVITPEQARELYDTLIDHYARHEVSSEVYEATGLMAGFPVYSDVEASFIRLIKFCEEKLDFVSEGEARAIVAAKQKAREDNEDRKRDEYRDYSRKFFADLGTFKIPADTGIRDKLREKLAQYEQRVEKYWGHQHPQFAFETEDGFRKTVLKIALAKRLLEAETEVNLLEFLNSMFERHGDLLDVQELVECCGVISVYLGTPILGAKISEKADSAVVAAI